MKGIDVTLHMQAVQAHMHTIRLIGNIRLMDNITAYRSAYKAGDICPTSLTVKT